MPEGWLWTNITLVASESMAYLHTILMSTIVPATPPCDIFAQPMVLWAWLSRMMNALS